MYLALANYLKSKLHMFSPNKMQVLATMINISYWLDIRKSVSTSTVCVKYQKTKKQATKPDKQTKTRITYGNIRVSGYATQV